MSDKLLVCVDLTETDKPVLEQAISLAKKTGASMELLHVVAPEPDFVGYTAFMYPGRDEHAHELRREKAALMQLADGLKERGVTANAYMKEAATVSGILEFAEHHDMEMIILGTHSHGLFQRVLLGSVVRDVVQQSHIPVLVVPPHS